MHIIISQLCPIFSSLSYKCTKLKYLHCRVTSPHIGQKYLKLKKHFTDSSPQPPYLLTPWCRVLLEKLTCLQLVKKFPAFYGTRRFITALTSVRRLSVSWASPMQSPYPHPTSWRSILILSTYLRLGLPSGSAIVTVH